MPCRTPHLMPERSLDAIRDRSAPVPAVPDLEDLFPTQRFQQHFRTTHLPNLNCIPLAQLHHDNEEFPVRTRRKAVQGPPTGCSLDTPSRVNTLGRLLEVAQRSLRAVLATVSALVYGAPPRPCADEPEPGRRRWCSTNVPDARCATLAQFRPKQLRIRTSRVGRHRHVTPGRPDGRVVGIFRGHSMGSFIVAQLAVVETPHVVSPASPDRT